MTPVQRGQNTTRPDWFGNGFCRYGHDIYLRGKCRWGHIKEDARATK